MIISEINIAIIGVVAPNHLSLRSKGHIIAEAIIGVKFGGWGIILEITKIKVKKNK